MIIGEIRRYLRDNNTIRVSRSVRDLAYRALAAKDKLSRTMGREPTCEEIVALLCENGTQCTKEDTADALEAISEPVSLYEPIWGENSSDPMYVMDSIADNDGGDDAWIEDIALKEALEKLNQRERDIINMRFFRGKTQMEIASEIGISQAQVSRLEKGALERMKKHMS